MSNNIQVATLGNGCFWCTEAIFQLIKDVTEVKSGYSGGEMANPDYETVCSGVPGHAECLNIRFDPQIISFKDLLEIFFATHDPTTLNRQGNDKGTQYRSVIFYHGEEQKETAISLMKELTYQKIFRDPIVTSLEIFSKFYPAEFYHNDYYRLNGSAPYCQAIIRPKVQKFQTYFIDKIKDTI